MADIRKTKVPTRKQNGQRFAATPLARAEAFLNAIGGEGEDTEVMCEECFEFSIKLAPAKLAYAEILLDELRGGLRGREQEEAKAVAVLALAQDVLDDIKCDLFGQELN